MKYIFDTNAISHLIRYPEGRVADQVATLKAEELGTSIIVAAELRFGCLKKGSERITQLVEGVLEDFQIVAWEEPADRRYGEIGRAHV
jgi:tRNA(fMet)-specific endonuclease VapC